VWEAGQAWVPSHKDATISLSLILLETDLISPAVAPQSYPLVHFIFDQTSMSLKAVTQALVHPNPPFSPSSGSYFSRLGQPVFSWVVPGYLLLSDVPCSVPRRPFQPS
jgi:hypothetical protein